MACVCRLTLRQCDDSSLYYRFLGQRSKCQSSAQQVVAKPEATLLFRALIVVHASASFWGLTFVLHNLTLLLPP